ncbi:MAG: peptide ABC transporter ATP-binding protein [Firmicutes bacterium ML8_F2]|nr:MAG: peptide ABC transporter ATP-binding protein [Firmicutes bacterium ML8_F2]
MEQLLSVNNLHVQFKTYAGVVKAVRGVSFDLQAGEVLAIVGESGCGKSVTAQSIMRLIPEPPGQITDGSIFFNGQAILSLSERRMQFIRGNAISMIFQDPMTSLNPVLNIRTQLIESIRQHKKMSKTEANRRAVEVLDLVGIPAPETRLKQYPYELSGGLRQRVMIAMALACDPQLLIADEPTTALDVTIQAQILELIKEINNRLQMALILITHDLGVVAGMADRVIVMYAGQIVETGTVDEVLKNPHHPYTWGLLQSLPRLDMTKKQRLQPIWGQPPDLLQDFAGCPFLPRCDYAMVICGREKPEAFGCNKVRCWLEHPQAPKVERKVKEAGGR